MRYRKLEGYKYELLDTVYYPVCVPTRNSDHATNWNHYLRIVNGSLIMDLGYAWDGPSGPTIDTPSFMRGSLVHDALYQLMREGEIDRKHRKYADELLRRICLEDGMNKFRAWYVYRAVRIFGRWTCTPRKNPRGKIVEI